MATKSLKVFFPDILQLEKALLDPKQTEMKVFNNLLRIIKEIHGYLADLPNSNTF